MIKKVIQTARNHSKFENTLDIIRIYLGIALFIKGIHFIINPQDLVYFLNQGQLNVIESFVSHYVISAHLVGGLLLTVGLLSRIGALIQIPVLVGALGLVHSNETLFSTNQNIELTAMVLFLLVIYAIIGAGNLSLDYHCLDEKGQTSSWIETKINQFFSREGHLLLVRLSSKITKKPTLIE
ncbi:MAG: DoxX family protein, partial [Candidatus Marinamargulisbacteria bacterium]